MGRLNSDQILQERKTSDPNSINSLGLNHKALSDVSCLVLFKNLERLDLGFNNLSSLEGLKACLNLKWLSVVQNKLQSLRGVEGLAKLTVLNAGKNQLRSIDEVKSLVSLRALILNDNEIVSICRFDQMKDLNTLVLSRNPIQKIGESLAKVKSITKLSLSKCQLKVIDLSLVSCVELKELRLSHNDIKSLPDVLARNSKLQNLDVGNNLISSWSNLKVLSSLSNLRNLNLVGNPIAQSDKLANKIKKLVPNLQIFNAKPIDKNRKNVKGDDIDDASLNTATELDIQKQERTDHTRGKKKFKQDMTCQSKDVDKERKENINDGKKLRKKAKKLKEDDEVHETNAGKQENTNSKKLNQGELDVIDDGETPFIELLSGSIIDDQKYIGDKQINDRGFEDVSSVGGFITFPARKKSSKKRRGTSVAAVQSSNMDEVGLGGPSAWGDE